MTRALNPNFSDALRASKQSLLAVATFSGVANLLMLVPAFFMLNVYDKAVGHNSVETLWALSLITAFLFLVLGSMEWIRSRVLVAISTRMDKILAPAIYRFTFQNAVNVGGQQASIQPLADLMGLRQFLTGAGIFALFDAPWLPVYLAVLFLFHPLLGWMGVLAALTFLALALMNQYRVGKDLATSNQLARIANAETQVNLRNAEVATSMGMVPELQERWQTNQDKLLAFQERASLTAGGFNAITKTLRLAVQSAAIAAGAYLVLLQEISPGMIIAGSILIGRALQPVELAVGAWKGFVEAKEQYERLDQILTLTPPASSKMSLPPLVGNISFKNLAVAPPGEKTATLQGVTAEIPAGSVCMILGPSGSGKSTLMRALLGLWPAVAGEVRLDGAEPNNFDRVELGDQLGYLPQDIELLDGSINSNIARFGAIDSEAVIRAATDAGVHEFILSLPNGYDTEIGKRGGVLSPGQRQRIGLARALYRQPRLVVLDEPNSNLDDVGEAALHQAVMGLKANGSTVLLVSHRKSTLPLADYLLVLVGGRLRQFGKTAEVLEKLKGPKSENSSDTTVVPAIRPSTVIAKKD